MITIARATKLTEASKEKVENESIEPNHGQATGVETEFYGGEHRQEPEDENLAGTEAWKAEVVFNRDTLVDILFRRVEVAAASRKGRKSTALMQMRMFDNISHEELHARLRSGTCHMHALLPSMRHSSTKKQFSRKCRLSSNVAAAI